MNLGYGALFGTALYFIGVPNAFLWGVLAGASEIRPVRGNSGGRRDADFIIACGFRRMVEAAAGLRIISW